MPKTNQKPRHKLPIFSGIIVSVVVFIVFFCMYFIFNGKSTENSRGVLNVLNWTSYIPADVIRDFENEYNIKVNYSTYSSNEELLAKISSSGSGVYDVIFPSDYMVSLMKSRDMLEKLDVSRLNNSASINPLFMSQPYDSENEYSLPFLLATTVIAYDSSKYDEISSYRDLMDEKFFNNLILIDDQRAIIGSMLASLGYSMNDTDPQHLTESLALFDTMRDNIKAFDSDSPKSFLITGEVDAGIIWNAEAILAKESRENIEMVYPEEGFVISMDNYCIVKNARNLDNAYLFINYLMRPIIARRIVAEYPYISAIRSVNDASDSELENIFARGTYIENIGPAIKSYDRLWAKYK